MAADRGGFVAVDVELSRAVTVYVRSPGYPHSDDLLAAFGSAAEALKPRIEALVSEMFALPHPWLGVTGPMELSDIGAVIEAEMGSRHPELSPEAVTSLANYYCFVWK